MTKLGTKSTGGKVKVMHLCRNLGLSIVMNACSNLDLSILASGDYRDHFYYIPICVFVS